MIITLIGANGSGKSTVVRKLLALDDFEKIFTAGRKSPLGYKYGRIFVVGAYEAASSSGCDTFGGDGRVEMLFNLIQEWHEKDFDVIYEGAGIMNHTKGIELWERTKALRVLQLTTRLEACFEGIRARRTVVGNTKPFGPNLEKNVRGNFVRAENYGHKLSQRGCPVFKVSREKALAKLLDILEDA